ncbi:hypothetical protein [Bradyrhizobium glycinis]|uniref:hypothetical protein n=1 Tax=Bradyrhizobium glycinis TaxID=2751812 RepID=UPI0018D9922E|nr:hypothetical protein [Bradyrhizobium glycinis]MBH5372963.1 hypothetical protein [Bradyrhizobium glycinis]
MASKRCKIHYRRLRRDNGQFPAEATLSKAIAAALKAKLPDRTIIGHAVVNRITSVPRQEEYKRLLNHHHVDEHYVFGDMCLFLPGQLQALLRFTAEVEHKRLDDVLKAFDIAEQKAPDGTEYLHGMAYWLACGDHFYMIQHVSIPTKAMEEYLTWLLRDQAGVIGHNHFVELQFEFDRAQTGDDLGDIRSVEVGGFVPETVSAEPKAVDKIVDVEEKETIGDRILRGFAASKKILVDLLGDVGAQQIIDAMPDEAALEVRVNISYRATKRKITKEFMSNLAAGLRNIAEGEIRIRGKDGEIKGEDARLSQDMSVKKIREASSLLDLEDALKQMLEVHRRFLYDGKITDTTDPV